MLEKPVLHATEEVRFDCASLCGLYSDVRLFRS